MKKLIAFFSGNSLFVNLLAIGVLIAGIIYLQTENREAFPKIDFDFVIVSTIYPGATPSDVEKHVTIEIEEQLREVDGIEELSSNSLESRSVVVVQLDPDLENKDKTVNDIKNAIDRIKDFPEDVEDPEVTELNTDQQPVLDISIINKNGIHNDADEFKMRKYASILEDRLITTTGVARIEKKGYRDHEMIVEVNPSLLDTYHVAINEVILALSRKNIDFPGGSVKSSKEEILIRTIGEVDNPREISNVLIRANDMGNWVRVGDVARVRDSFEEVKIINKTEGQQSIALTIQKKSNSDIIDVVEEVTKKIETFKKILPDNYDIILNNDLSYFVKRRLDVLINNGLVGLILVILSLFITLGWRIALVTSLGVPLAFSGTFIWMGIQGVTINLMSMFGLIMVLGMVVDDAIIVAENIYRHIEDGEDVKGAVINGTAEVIIPVAGTIMTTIAAFAPLMFMSGIMGKFIWTLPAVVSVSLIASWVESMFILPSHVYDVEKNRSRRQGVTDGESLVDKTHFFEKIWAVYRGALSGVLHHRYIFSILIFILFAGTIAFGVLKVKFILFPQGNIETLTIKAEAPTGTTVQKMSERMSLIEKRVAQLPEHELDSYTTRAGIIQESPTDPFTKRGSNYGIIMVYLTPMQSRERDAEEITVELRKKCAPIENNFEKLEFDKIRTGPPQGEPVSVTIKGDDFNVLQKIAAEYKDYLKTIDGVFDVKDTYEEGKTELLIHAIPQKAALTGITVYDIANTVRSCYEGTVATSIKKTDEEIDIRVIFPDHLRKSTSSISRIKIANKMGNLVPLASISYVTYGKGISVINREDWKRSISVTADIEEEAEGVSSVTVNRKLIDKFADIEDRYQEYTVDYEGEFKDTQESVENLVRSFLIAALVIYIILVALFRSLIHPIVIMGVIPLTLVGVIWAFYFHGLPLSFLGLMGVVGLTGVIVNDSIVLVSFINNNRKKHMELMDACIDAGVKRLRPVFLTTITTVFGLLPTAYGWGGFDPFLVPMAVSMSWGLLFGSTITLFGTPILYMVFSDIRYLFVKRDDYAEKAKNVLINNDPDDTSPELRDSDGINIPRPAGLKKNRKKE